jgi:peptidoglycan/LPS O-acetylase OafA/YrhL
MFADFGVPISLPAFMVGIIIYFMQQSVVISRRGARILLAGSLLAFVAIAYTKLPLRNVWMVVPLGAFTIALLQAGPRLFVNNITQYMGQRSYSAFFINAIVLHFLASQDLKRLGFFAALVVTIAATFLISEITYRLIEQPSQDAGRKIIAWFRQSRLPAADSHQPAAAAGEKVAP